MSDASCSTWYVLGTDELAVLLSAMGAKGFFGLELTASGMDRADVIRALKHLTDKGLALADDGGAIHIDGGLTTALRICAGAKRIMRAGSNGGTLLCAYSSDSGTVITEPSLTGGSGIRLCECSAEDIACELLAAGILPGPPEGVLSSLEPETGEEACSDAPDAAIEILSVTGGELRTAARLEIIRCALDMCMRLTMGAPSVMPYDPGYAAAWLTEQMNADAKENALW